MSGDWTDEEIQELQAALRKEREKNKKLRKKLKLKDANYPRAKKADKPLQAINAEMIQLENSSETMWAHKASICKGDICPLHKRTDHNMRSWRQHWRSDRWIFERICPRHGSGCPDPDTLTIINGTDDGIHACCGCESMSQQWWDDLCHGCGATNTVCHCGHRTRDW